MSIRLFRRMAALICSLALLFTLSPAAFAAGTPAVSDNSMTSGYGSTQSFHAKPVTSYLFENPQGNLTRVEYIANQLWRMNGNSIEIKWEKNIVVEDYTPDFQFLSGRTIPMELDIWGGFFAGEKYNFFIFGQDNPQESDSVEVLRVVKYDKSWNRLGQASLYGADTFASISFSSVDCAEDADVLYVRTAHEMYKSKDGKNHQSNMTFTVQESTMAMTPYARDPGYVSHSFKQLILIDSEGNILGADHGDAYPRAFRLTQYKAKAGDLVLLPPPETHTWDQRYPTYVDFNPFPGNPGQNDTFGKLQGLAEVLGGYVLTYIYRNNVYLAYIAKEDLAEGRDGTAKLTKLTNHVENNFATANLAYGAAMVFTNLTGGYVLWTEQPKYTGQTHYAPDRVLYAAYGPGGAVGPIQTFAEGRLSDCQPIFYRGQVVWYQTENSVPTFYTLDDSGAAAVRAKF